MTNQSIIALVVTSPGTLQNGLLALMTTIPPINAVLVAEDGASAMRMVGNHQPALVILELSLPNVREAIKQIAAQWSHIDLIVIIDDISQVEEVQEIEATSVLVKGFTASKLVALIEGMLSQGDIDYRIEPQ